MLIHLTPRFYLPPEIPVSIEAVDLVRLTIAELGVCMGPTEVVTRHPYPNKRFYVGARRDGRKAIEGLFFDAPGHVGSYTAVAEWAINGELLVTHRTEYVVLDNTFDAVTDNMILWYATGDKRWTRRWPDALDPFTPAQAQPRMEIFSPALGGEARETEVQDDLAPNGLILKRTERFPLHSVERERVVNTKYTDRMPEVRSIIHCSTLQAA